MAEFARLFPRTILDSELAILIRDKTAQVYGAVSEVIAETSAVLSVAGRTGHVTLTARDVGLENVANIGIADWPMSNGVQAALDTKRDKATKITQAEVETLIEDLAARVRSVNGSPPDAQGNVVVDTGQMNFIPKPVENPDDGDTLTWVNGMGWTPVSILQHLQLFAAKRILPDPTSLADGTTIAVVDNAWVVQTGRNVPDATTATAGQVMACVDGQWEAQTLPAPVLTSPDGTTYKLTVSNAGALSAVAVP